MSRLIDADKFKHYVKEHCKDSLADLWCVLIDRQPTAFDTEKVVEQLEEKIEIAWGDDYIGGRKDAFNEAIDIVKKGGVE